MLAAYTQTFLRIGDTLVFCGLVAQDYILELVHAGICKHQCGIIFYDHRGRWHDMVLLGAEKVFERLSYFLSCKHCKYM